MGDRGHPGPPGPPGEQGLPGAAGKEGAKVKSVCLEPFLAEGLPLLMVSSVTVVCFVFFYFII